MNRVYHKRITIDFDVWEPQEGLVQTQMDRAVRAIKAILIHGANIHIGSTDEKIVES